MLPFHSDVSLRLAACSSLSPHTDTRIHSAPDLLVPMRTLVLGRVAGLACLLACALGPPALAAPSTATPAQAILLPENATFTAIESCLPINLLIAPGEAYALDASPAVVPTLTPSGILRLGVRSFNATGPVKARVTLPADALARVSANGGGSVTVAPGFNSSALALVNSGPATLYVSGLANNASTVAISQLGPGVVVLDSAVKAVTVEGGGSGAAFVRGVLRSVAVDLGGMARAVVDPAAADVAITGATSALAHVEATRGICSVSSANGGFFGPPCAPVSTVVLPPAATTWSCGMAVRVDGVLGCDPAAGQNAVVIGGGGGAVGAPGAGTYVSTGGAGPGRGMTTTMTSTSGGGVAMSSSSGGGVIFTSGGGVGGGGTSFMTSSGGPGGGAVFSTGGGGGGFYTINPDGTVTQAPVIRAPVCKATAADLEMTLE